MCVHVFNFCGQSVVNIMLIIVGFSLEERFQFEKSDNCLSSARFLVELEVERCKRRTILTMNYHIKTDLHSSIAKANLEKSNCFSHTHCPQRLILLVKMKLKAKTLGT